MARPRKPEGTRVVDLLHVGWRLSLPQTNMMEAVMAAKRAAVQAMGLPASNVTVSGLARVWLEERLIEEFGALTPEQKDQGDPAIRNAKPVPAPEKKPTEEESNEAYRRSRGVPDESFAKKRS
jgi:hypothetical protein